MNIQAKTIEKTRELIGLSHSNPQNGSSTCLCIQLEECDSPDDIMNLVGTTFTSVIESEVRDYPEKYTFYMDWANTMDFIFSYAP